MKKKKKQKQQVAEILLEYLTGVYIGFMLLVFPLAFHNAYFDIFTTKRYVYLAATGVFLIFAIVLAVVLFAQHSLHLIKKVGKPVFLFAALELCYFVFSLLLVENPTEMFWGVSGRRLGVLVMVMCILTMVFAAAYGTWQTSIEWCLWLGAVAVYILQITDEFQVNLLGMHLENVQDTSFISTIGNINFNAAFNCLTLPIGVALYMNAKDMLHRLMYGVFCLIGFAATICCRSDSGIMGIFIIFIVLLFIKKSDVVSNIRYANLFAMWGVASAVFAGIYKWAYPTVYQIDGTIRIMVEGRWVVTELIIAVIWHLLLWRCHKKEHFWKILHKIVGVTVIAGMVTVTAVIFWINVKQVDMTNYPELVRYVVFDNYWGSRRGFIWSQTWKQYLQFDIKGLLFGCGITNFKTTAVIESAELGLAVGATIDAHCELLQMLFTTGIVGTAGYFGMAVSALAASIRAYRNNHALALMGILAVSSYLAQGLVNNLQIATTPLWFILLGLFCAVSKKDA